MGDLRYIYQRELDRVFIQLDMVYEDSKVLLRRTASDKVLPDKAFNNAKSSKFDGYQKSFASVVYNVYDKKSSDCAIKSEIILNQCPPDLATWQLAEEFHKPIIRKLY